MSSLFGGGGGGGKAPVAPKLKQVDTSLTGPLYTRSAAMGDRWANMMRGSYGLQPATAEAPASWQAQYLGPGALAMMRQAKTAIAGGQDPQVQGALQKGFGAAPNLGSDPYELARQLGQAPLSELSRNQQFEMGLQKQWQPPDLRLTGEDLLNVKMQQMTQNARAQQAAFEAATQGASAASQAQSAAQAAGTAALGKIGSAAISAYASPSLSSSGYYTPSIGPAFSGDVYGAGTSTSEALGPSMEAATGGGGSIFGS